MKMIDLKKIGVVLSLLLLAFLTSFNETVKLKDIFVSNQCPNQFVVEMRGGEFVLTSQKKDHFFETLIKALKKKNSIRLFLKYKPYQVSQKSDPFFDKKREDIVFAFCPSSEKIIIYQDNKDELYYSKGHHTYALKKASLYYIPEFLDEFIFQKSLNRYSYLNLFFLELRSIFKKQGYDLNSYGINKMEESDMVLTFWKPHLVDFTKYNKNTFLFLFESTLDLKIEKNEQYNQYKKIFTYNRQLSDDNKYIFSLLPYVFDDIDFSVFKKKKKLLTMIILGNHSPYGYVNSNFSFYFKRKQIVKWFLENKPLDIEIYGSNWGNLKSELSKKGQDYFKTQYKGEAYNKVEALSDAKFSIAFENAVFPGYISEKIFDAMKAGTVPIYLGAQNVTDYIPVNTFIDYRRFKSIDELYEFLNTMSDDVYNDYLENIQNFIQHFDQTPFYYKTVAKKLEYHIFELKNQ